MIVINKLIEENKIELDFHIFDDVSENNEQFELELGKYFFEDKFLSFPSIIDYLENHSKKIEKSIFFAINNRKKETNNSGIKRIQKILVSQYDNVEHGIQTNLKHKIVNNLIDKITINDLKNPQNQNAFLDVSILKKELVNYSEDIKNNNEQEIEESMDAINNLESILLDLHTLGIIVYFKDDKLKNILVTSPNWFNKVIFS